MKKYGILLSMILLLMTGCRQKDDSIVISDESASYAEETWDVGITPEYQPMAKEQCNKQLAMMEYVRVDTLENQTIRSIILEEAQYYFQGIKGLEETCEIIQNRVQIYLDETKS